ncbi:potassium transporter TrkG [Idiomarina sp. Sol25]|uniref:TrkH family potassium uptake protein n=1 Tax=Idiomarina TaxID=135575 RepID=UPI00294AD988|nr:potassium transporter TrkG [Idiomarina sp. Sol25]MDV6328222.1 potassium transporter TrkG [Idiomarina sp. Sol25]
MKQWLPSFFMAYTRARRSRHKKLKVGPPVVLAGGFFVLILFGALLLKLPFATVEPITWLESLFTAASAVTVTGLVVVDTGQAYTPFGLTVIAMLIQTGGIGFMTFAILAVMSMGGNIGISYQLVAREAMQQTSLKNIAKTARTVFYLALIVELLGTVVLTLTWWGEFGFWGALGEAAFYSISAFNNAGFALSANSLSDYVGSIPVNLVVTFMFIVGGLGFSVLMNIFEKRRWNQFSVYTRSILIATLLINILSAFIFWLLEHSNPNTLGSLSTLQQTLASWFQATTPRTAGFNTVDIGQLREPTSMYVMLLMFIGGGSMSTGGGIKLGTFIVLMMATYAFLRRRQHVTLMQRSIEQQMVMKALAVSMITLLMAFLGIFFLMILNPLPFIDVSFEVLSALATVGLSRGITGELTEVSQVLVIILMFAGRVGPLTLVYFLTTPHRKRVRYPKTEVQVG